MNAPLLAAGILTILLGLAHSIIGEILIFKKLRVSDGAVGGTPPNLSRRQRAALWSTWHLLTILGFGIGGVLLVLSWNASATIVDVKPVLVATFAASTTFWLYGTSGKHPAWIVLLIIAALLWLA